MVEKQPEIVEEVKEEVIEEVVDDEAILDKEIEDSINSVKSGEELEAKPEVKPEEVEEPGTPPVETEEPVMDFKMPLKTKFESDEVYEKRSELMTLIQRKKSAVTPEQKQNLSDQIQNTRNDIRDLSIGQKKEEITNPNEVVKNPEDLDPTIAADRERLKQLGGTTEEDIRQIMQDERMKQNVNTTLERFVERHHQFKDEDVRDVFFDFVDNNYNWQNKSGKELMTVLELARENMFKPSESIQERVLKGANVAEKVNTMQFPGGTNVKTTVPADVKDSVAELVATGMSEEKALELLEEE